MKEIILSGGVESLIHTVRKQQVMLDSDLAKLYRVETKVLNRMVKRHLERFPAHFMFELTKKEYEVLRCQFGASKKGSGGRRYMPYAFTEHGVLMLGNVLNSRTAIKVSIRVIEVFIRLRELAYKHREFSKQIKALEKKVGMHDKRISAIIDAMKQLMEPPAKSNRRIGY